MNSDDDIVTRLQQWGTHEYLKDTNINAIMCEAADEIERLRSLLRRIATLSDDEALPWKEWSAEWDRVMEEARRG